MAENRNASHIGAKCSVGEVIEGSREVRDLFAVEGAPSRA
jgi:hypothetical protein